MQGLPLLLKRIPKIIINSTGITYFRAHAIIDGVNYWSLEKILTVSAPPIIIVTSIPGRPIENSNYTIKWQVSGGLAGDVSKTELLWDLSLIHILRAHETRHD